MPLPSNPVLQVHSKLPGVLVQSALTLQLSVKHSLISGDNLALLYIHKSNIILMLQNIAKNGSTKNQKNKGSIIYSARQACNIITRVIKNVEGCRNGSNREKQGAVRQHTTAIYTPYVGRGYACIAYI